MKWANNSRKRMHDGANAIGNLLVEGFHYMGLFAIGGVTAWASVMAFMEMLDKGHASIDDILLLFIYLELGAMVVGLEIDPHHRAQFQVDEQQQDVIDTDPALAEHVQERHHRRVGGDRADAEQGEVVECLDAQIAQRVGRAMQALAQLFRPFDVHDIQLPDTT